MIRAEAGEVEGRRHSLPLPSAPAALSIGQTSLRWVTPTSSCHFMETAAAIVSVSITSLLLYVMCSSPKSQNCWPYNHSCGENSAHIIFLGLVSVTIGTSLKVLVNIQPPYALHSVAANNAPTIHEDERTEIGIKC